MTATISIYLDESGDLGWRFDRPYRAGGSSRYITIACVLTPAEKEHLPKRFIRKLYKKFSWTRQGEVKWADMNAVEREHFARQAYRLTETHPDIKFFSITTHKQNVQQHMRDDSNLLYNYMIKLLLIDEMSQYQRVNFYPDQRSIKVASGNSLHDYLRIQLGFEKSTQTELITRQSNSSESKNLQFSDMLAGLVQSHFEDKNSRFWNLLDTKIHSRRLFFPAHYKEPEPTIINSESCDPP